MLNAAIATALQVAPPEAAMLPVLVLLAEVQLLAQELIME